MSVTVTANDRTVVHRGSQGTGYAYPDTCRTPPSNIPVPYANGIVSADADGTCGSVFCDGYPVMNTRSFFARSYLDEKGTGGGIISGCNMGKASFYTFSLDVFFEGAPAPRHLDGTLQNHGSPANAISVLLQIAELLAIEVKLCIIVCFCNKPGFKTRCLDMFLADPTLVWNKKGRSGWAWDPRFPHVWVEVPYSPSGNYWPSDTLSKYQKDASGNPLHVPESWEYSKSRNNSSRPDVIVTANPHEGPDKDNIARIFEIKFDKDPTKGEKFEDQLERYEDIAKTTVLTPERCGCKGSKPKSKKEPKPKPVTAPIPVAVLAAGTAAVAAASSKIPWTEIGVGVGIGAAILITGGTIGPAAAAAARAIPAWLPRFFAL